MKFPKTEIGSNIDLVTFHGMQNIFGWRIQLSSIQLLLSVLILHPILVDHLKYATKIGLWNGKQATGKDGILIRNDHYKSRYWIESVDTHT